MKTEENPISDITLDGTEIDYSRLPEHMQAGMKRYIERRVPPGDFLYSVLGNNFVRAINYADHININYLQAYAAFLIWEAPYECWGSEEKVNKWLNEKD